MILFGAFFIFFFFFLVLFGYKNGLEVFDVLEGGSD